MLASPGSANLVEWYGYFQTHKTTGSFEIHFFNDDNGLPENTAFSSTTVSSATGIDTGLLHNSIYKIVHWSAEIPTVSLAADKSWISIQSQSLVNESSYLWSASSGTLDGSTVMWKQPYDPSSPWHACLEGWGRDNQAFKLSNVPEPSTLAIWSLLALCTIGIGWRRRNAA